MNSPKGGVSADGPVIIVVVPRASHPPTPLRRSSSTSGTPDVSVSSGGGLAVGDELWKHLDAASRDL
ncbi:hypothetical protein [Halopenitus persicus]|nr:hypothetical protein [Halopenitus persicus]